MWQNDTFYFLPCFVSVEFSNNPKNDCQPCKNFKNFFLHKILVIILLNHGNVLFLLYETSKCPFSSFFQTHLKKAFSSQYFNHKKAFLGHKHGSISHKKFQRFQKWGQMLS